jgi:hypothetical protein
MMLERRFVATSVTTRPTTQRRMPEEHSLQLSRRENRKTVVFNHLKPTGHVIHQQFNIQHLYALPTLYLCVLYLSENKQRLVPLAA